MILRRTFQDKSEKESVFQMKCCPVINERKRETFMRNIVWIYEGIIYVSRETYD